jgi:hypothetical protein
MDADLREAIERVREALDLAERLATMQETRGEFDRLSERGTRSALPSVFVGDRSLGRTADGVGCTAPKAIARAALEAEAGE